MNKFDAKEHFDNLAPEVQNNYLDVARQGYEHKDRNPLARLCAPRQSDWPRSWRRSA
jgi:hypothetical protein